MGGVEWGVAGEPGTAPARRGRRGARGRRVLIGVYAGCGLALVPWTGVLIAQLHGQAGKRSFGASWVGLDLLEAGCLLAVAWLVVVRHRVTSPVAAATAAVLCVDAWFDTMSAPPQWPYAESMAMATFAELPLAALLGFTAWRALAWAGPRPGAAHAAVARGAGEGAWPTCSDR